MFNEFKMPKGKPGTITKDDTNRMFQRALVLTVPWMDMSSHLIELAQEKMRLWTEQDGFFSFNIPVDQESICLGWEYEIQEGQNEIVDWNELSRMGLMYALNVCVFHQHGFAVARRPDTGTSHTFLFDNVDQRWTYSDEDHAEGREKLSNFGFQIPELAINDRV